jgi:hypothetical protein
LTVFTELDRRGMIFVEPGRGGHRRLREPNKEMERIDV